MREHMGLFRGKRVDNDEWVMGGLYDHKEPHESIFFIVRTDIDAVGNAKLAEFHLVYKDTVGEYTGMTDRNGKLIFEGDLFRFDDECIGVVIFKDGCFRMQVYGLCGTYTESGYDECDGGWDIVECETIDWYYIHNLNIIGNAHDNPELLEGAIEKK